LLSVRNGQCYSWAEFFRESIRAQGVETIDALSTDTICRKTVAITQVLPPSKTYLAVKSWSTNPTSSTYWLIPGQPWIKDTSSTYYSYWDAGVTGNTPATISVGQAADAQGTRGQGTSFNPPAYFGQHFIVGLWITDPTTSLPVLTDLYDPSYGANQTNVKDYEAEAFQGNIKQELGQWLLYPLSTNQLCQYNKL
jgi:hypothetical protein